MFRFLRSLLPRSRSPIIYGFTMACYMIALDALLSRLVVIFGLWPARAQAAPAIERIVNLPIGYRIFSEFLISPIVESLGLIGVIELMRWFGFKDITGVIVSTALICLLHTATVPIFGLIVVPAFLIGTASYVYWRHTSFWTGLGMIVFLHFASNIIPVLRALGRNR